MNKYSKAIAAFITSAVGLVVAYGVMDEGQGQQLVVMMTAAANLAGVYLVRNAR